MFKTIDDKLINQIIKESRTAPRKRARSRFHKYQENIQRMVVSFQKDAYIQPHKHEKPDKVEIFIALKGKFLALCFDDSGSIIEYAVFGEKEKTKGIEIPPRVYHAFWPLLNDSVIYEVIEGPYIPSTHKKFAPWAPSESEFKKSKEYIRKIKLQLNIL